jgi:DNA-binding NarL/FixJ family response regulator
MIYKLLIVDDSKLARMSAAKALNALYPDWTRVEAATADEAVSLGNSNSFDIALLDYNMPGRDGLQLAAELKAANPSMPIAIVSANHQDEIVARAKAIGASFLQKPLTQNALREFLQLALAQIQAANR